MNSVFRNFKITLSFYFRAAALLFSILAIIVYGITGKNAFTPELSSAVLGVGIAFMVFQAVETILCCVIKNTDAGHIAVMCQYVLAVLAFLSFAMFVAYNVNYLASIMASIDGTKITASFVVTAIFFVLASAMAVIAAVLYGGEIRGCEKGEV